MTQVKKAKEKDLAVLCMESGAMGSDGKPVANMSQLQITSPWVKGVVELPQSKSTLIPIKEKKKINGQKSGLKKVDNFNDIENVASAVAISEKKLDISIDSSISSEFKLKDIEAEINSITQSRSWNDKHTRPGSRTGIDIFISDYQ